MEISKKIVEWSISIKVGKLEGIANDLEKLTSANRSKKLDPFLIKIIVRLCHFSSTCDRSNVAVGMDISDIAQILCSSFTTIPEPDRFFSALYHIIKALLEMKLYKQAQELCDFFTPKSLWGITSNNFHKQFSQFLNMWYEQVKLLIAAFRPNDEKQIKVIIDLIKFDIKMRALVKENSYTNFVTSLRSYYNRIKVLDDGKYEYNIKKIILETFSRANICVIDNKKYEVFNLIIHIMSDMIHNKIRKNIVIISNEINQILDAFKKTMKTDAKCYACFKLLCQGYKILAKPIEELTKEFSKDVNSYVNNIDLILKHYGYDNEIQSTLSTISSLIIQILAYWGDYAESNKNDNLVVLTFGIMPLSNFLSKILSQFDKTCQYHSDCLMKKDLYNDVFLKMEPLTIISCFNSELTKDSQASIVEIIKQCITVISKIKKSSCDSWINLSNSYEARMHNIAINFEKIDPDFSCLIYKLLCWGINRLKAINPSDETLNSSHERRISTALHRISVCMWIAKQYHHCMIAVSLNAFLGYKTSECKAFRMWANTKRMYPSAQDVTILQFLKSNMNEYEEFYVKITPEILDTIDKEFMCLQEIKGLQAHASYLSPSITAVLDSMELMNTSPMSYIQGVVLLGYDLLHYKSNLSIQNYIKKALSYFVKMKLTASHELLIGHLNFFALIEKLKEIQIKMEKEMEDSKIQLYATKEVKLTDPAKNVVPAYSLISLKTSVDIAGQFEKILQIWIECFNKGVFKKHDDTIDIKMSLKIFKTAAEYAKFYKFCKLEIKTWKLAYNLAEIIKDDQALIYITSRSIMSHYVKSQWIQQAFESINNLKISTNKDDIESIAMFKLSLINFYFHTGKVEEAKNLLSEVITMPIITFATNNFSTYLMSLDVLLTYGTIYQGDNTLNKYIDIIIKGLYTLLIIDDHILDLNINRDQFLYHLDTVFQFSDHIALRMNNLVAFREISAHICRRLTMAQKLNSTLHVAECLKNLCYIDLSRNLVDDCEVKLQGLEHILQLETFEASAMKKNSPKINIYHETIPIKMVEPVRDIFQNDTSPVLAKKIFISPDFMQHDLKCRCFQCWNTYYQHLVFSCTYIRAQLYASQKQKENALEHFYGAFEIIRKLLNFSENRYGHEFGYYNIVEYILFLLDVYQFFVDSLFIDPNEALNIVLHAIEICEKYEIINHPVYLSLQELIFEYRFQKMVNEDFYLSFVVPSINNFDVDNNYENEVNDDSITCLTPLRDIDRKIMKVKKKTPPLISLDNAFVDTFEDDSCTELIPFIKKAEERKDKKKTLKIRPIRRKISEKEYSSPESNSSSQPEFINKSTNRLKATSTVTSNQFELETAQLIASAASLKIHSDTTEELNKNTSSRTKSRSQKVNEPVASINKNEKEKFMVKDKKVDEMTYILEGIKISEPSLKPSRSQGFNTNESNIRKKINNSSSASLTVQKTSERLKKVSESESENEVIESSYVEVRRSKRIVKKTSTKTKEISSSSLKLRN